MTANRIAIEVLEAAISEQCAWLDRYGPASEAIAVELARAADWNFFADFLGRRSEGVTSRLYREISEWGVDEAFRRALPATLADSPFKPFASGSESQETVDEFLFSCGCLRLAERMLRWLREGLVTGEYREHDDAQIGPLRVLILRGADPSFGNETIGRAGLRWEADARVRLGRERERDLMQRFREIEPDLASRCELFAGFLPIYDTAYERLDYFEDVADHYLDRIFGKDLIAPDDMIGGFPFQSYLDAVRVLSGLQHLHLAVLHILRARHHEVELRTLLAWPSPVETTLGLVSRQLGCDPDVAASLIAPLTLTRAIAERHAKSGDPAWPCLIWTSERTYIHPLFGLDINPFTFLLANLREMHRADWDRAANRREGRWQTELHDLIAAGRYDQIRKAGLLLRDGRRHLTDIDFAAFDRRSGDLLLVQLKWQHPIGGNDAVRRSMARNFVEGGNQWAQVVTDWIDEHGADELVRRLGFTPGSSPRPRLLVLARYNAQFSGEPGRDRRAVWASWPHFRKAWKDVGRKPARDLFAFLRRVAADIKRRRGSYSATFRIGSLAVLLEPRRVPEASRD